MSTNIIQHNFKISREDHNRLNGHKSFVVWFTGLSGSGKSTIANNVEQKLFAKRIHTFSLDGDNIRRGLNADLGFSRKNREENLRRIAEVAKLSIESGKLVIASFISPLRKDREFLKKIIGEDDFVEIFINTPLRVCEERDVKGLYKKARAGEIKNFTGISAPYENPVNPNIEIKTEEESIKAATDRIIIYLTNKLETKNQ
ncbi:adenylylsulfate kinase [Salegentibacter echinorum]|uniref:Adenylyl-sulfate kinase n=1 Tax=Salegentibacter echinorum TaxID=1073325 RepID=A0A1M5FGD2_SALEC|nr:adenylyl-sulfate kinase [Salegentibacter echinorum]SHF90545.1 adenylylsulfate kinase [Salegentibacter echinorum]